MNKTILTMLVGGSLLLPAGAVQADEVCSFPIPSVVMSAQRPVIFSLNGPTELLVGQEGAYSVETIQNSSAWITWMSSGGTVDSESQNESWCESVIFKSDVPGEFKLGAKVVDLGTGLSTQRSLVVAVLSDSPSHESTELPTCLRPPNNKFVCACLADEIEGVDVSDHNLMGPADNDSLFSGHAVCLRAKRRGQGNGRVYSVHTNREEITVRVPHDESSGCSEKIPEERLLKDEEAAEFIAQGCLGGPGDEEAQEENSDFPANEVGEESNSGCSVHRVKNVLPVVPPLGLIVLVLTLLAFGFRPRVVG